jgi:uncharacterized damage-inducible protein DinB
MANKMPINAASQTDLSTIVGRAFVDRARDFLSNDYLPKIERCLEQLTDEQIWWRPNPNSNSIGNLILHLSGNARQWIVAGLGGEHDERKRDLEFSQREIIERPELRKHLKSAIDDVDRVLKNLSPDSLLTNHTIQGKDVDGLEAVFHVTEHFSMHTGQIILMTKMLTERDLSFYDFPDGVPLSKWHNP